MIQAEERMEVLPRPRERHDATGRDPRVLERARPAQASGIAVYVVGSPGASLMNAVA